MGGGNRPATQRRAKLRLLYGIDEATYDAMYEAQEGLCAICRKPETSRFASGVIKRLAVDHNAESKQVRGLLCNKHNQGLGYFQHDPSLLLRAVHYLMERDDDPAMAIFARDAEITGIALGQYLRHHGILPSLPVGIAPLESTVY